MQRLPSQNASPRVVSISSSDHSHGTNTSSGSRGRWGSKMNHSSGSNDGSIHSTGTAITTTSTTSTTTSTITPRSGRRRRTSLSPPPPSLFLSPTTRTSATVASAMASVPAGGVLSTPTGRNSGSFSSTNSTNSINSTNNSAHTTPSMTPTTASSSSSAAPSSAVTTSSAGRRLLTDRRFTPRSLHMMSSSAADLLPWQQHTHSQAHSRSSPVSLSAASPSQSSSHLALTNSSTSSSTSNGNGNGNTSKSNHGIPALDVHNAMMMRKCWSTESIQSQHKALLYHQAKTNMVLLPPSSSQKSRQRDINSSSKRRQKTIGAEKIAQRSSSKTVKATLTYLDNLTSPKAKSESISVGEAGQNGNAVPDKSNGADVRANANAIRDSLDNSIHEAGDDPSSLNGLPLEKVEMLAQLTSDAYYRIIISKYQGHRIIKQVLEYFESNSTDEHLEEDKARLKAACNKILKLLEEFPKSEEILLYSVKPSSRRSQAAAHLSHLSSSMSQLPAMRRSIASANANAADFLFGGHDSDHEDSHQRSAGSKDKQNDDTENSSSGDTVTAANSKEDEDILSIINLGSRMLAEHRKSSARRVN